MATSKGKSSVKGKTGMARNIELVKEQAFKCGGPVKRMASGGKVKGAGKAIKGTRKCKMM